MTLAVRETFTLLHTLGMRQQLLMLPSFIVDGERVHILQRDLTDMAMYE